MYINISLVVVVTGCITCTFIVYLTAKTLKPMSAVNKDAEVLGGGALPAKVIAFPKHFHLGNAPGVFPMISKIASCCETLALGV